MSEADLTEAAKKITEAFSALTEGPRLREEVARLKAIKAKQTGEITGLKVENNRLRKEAEHVENQREELDSLNRKCHDLSKRNAAQADVIAGLRREASELQSTANAETADRALDEMIKRKDEVMEQISANNATLREQLEDQRKATRSYRDQNIALRDALNEIRRALSALDEED